MERSSGILICAVMLAGYCNAQESGNSPLKGKYFGQKTPGNNAEVFAPGIISVPEAKYTCITFSGNGDEFYLYRWDGASATILFSRISDGVWTPLKEPDFTKGYIAREPHLTLDNKTVYFIWDKPLPAGEKETPFKIWYSARSPNGWTIPEYAGIGMYVTSDTEGNIYTTDMTTVMSTGKTYLARVKTSNKRFVDYERLSIPQYYGSQAHPCIAPDGSYILFDVDSGNHLFVSFRKKDLSWSDAIDLADHGFEKMAGGASLTPDGRYLFFNLQGKLMWIDSKVIMKLKPED